MLRECCVGFWGWLLVCVSVIAPVGVHGATTRWQMYCSCTGARTVVCNVEGCMLRHFRLSFDTFLLASMATLACVVSSLHGLHIVQYVVYVC